jgi:hypothetical protein
MQEENEWPASVAIKQVVEAETCESQPEMAE